MSDLHDLMNGHTVIPDAKGIGIDWDVLDQIESDGGACLMG